MWLRTEFTFLLSPLRGVSCGSIMCPGVHFWFEKCTRWNQSSRNGTCFAATCRLLTLMFYLLFWFGFYSLPGSFLKEVKEHQNCPLLLVAKSTWSEQSGFVSWGKINLLQFPMACEPPTKSWHKCYSLTGLNQRCQLQRLHKNFTEEGLSKG